MLGPGALLGEDDVELGFGGKDNVSGFMSSVASVVDPKGGVFTCWALEWCFFRGSLKNLTFLFSQRQCKYGYLLTFPFYTSCDFLLHNLFQFNALNSQVKFRH